MIHDPIMEYVGNKPHRKRENQMTLWEDLTEDQQEPYIERAFEYLVDMGRYPLLDEPMEEIADMELVCEIAKERYEKDWAIL